MIVRIQHIIMLWFVLCFSYTTHSQDIHFSNFYTNVLHVNPAYAGFFNGTYRFSATIRDQYRTVAIPYKTATITFDTKQSLKTRQRDYIGYGAIFTYDIAGDSYFSSTQFSIPLAFHTGTTQNIWQSSFGIIPGLFSNSIDYSLLRFPDQFDGVKFNEDAITNEEFDNNGKLYFNIGAGARFMYTPNRKYRYGIGGSVYNITQPNISFYNNKNVILPIRYLVHASAQIEVTPQVDILPGLKFQFQGAQQEYHFGLMALKHTNNIQIPRIFGGAWFRSRDKDAIILGLGMLYKGYEIVLNYDINISSLRTASGGHGAVELTVTYIWHEHQKRRRMTPVKCPGFL